MYTYIEGLYQSCTKIWLFKNLFPFFVNVGSYGSKKIKRHLVWKYTLYLLPKSMHAPGKGLYQSYIQNCENFKFWIFWHIYFLCLTMSAELIKLKFVRRPSVRLWRRLSLKLLHGFLSKFSCGFHWVIHVCPDVSFLFIYFIFYEYFSFSLNGTLWERIFQNATPPWNNF